MNLLQNWKCIHAPIQISLQTLMHYISFHLVKFDLRESALPNVNLELIYLVQTQQSVHRALITVLQEIKAKHIF